MKTKSKVQQHAVADRQGGYSTPPSHRAVKPIYVKQRKKAK